MIGRALARFFCGLLIGSNVGVNAKWISTIISRLKALINTNQTSSSSIPTYKYANLQQEHGELRACVFFQPSHKHLFDLGNIVDAKMSRLKSDSELETVRFRQAVYIYFFFFRIKAFPTIVAVRLGMRESLHALSNS